MKRAVVLVFLVFLFATQSRAQQSPRSQIAVSQELRELFESDQAKRQRPPATTEESQALAAADGKRAIRVKEIIAKERLETANDFLYAATVLHHNSGNIPEDALTAHILFTIAGFKGSLSARYLSAAALDVYLRQTGRQQVFGTDPRLKIEHDTISDAIRTVHCVLPLTDGNRHATTQLRNCPR
jgi:hypothetical protein